MMRRLRSRRLRVALAGIALLSPAHAQDAAAWTGRRLLQACEAPNADPPGGACAVFIRAVLDRFHEALATRCPRTEAAFGALVAGVRADLEERSAELDRPAAALVLQALERRYRCTR